MFKYSINLNWSEEDKNYVATVFEFPGLSAFGETPEDLQEQLIMMLADVNVAIRYNNILMDGEPYHNTKLIDAVVKQEKND